VVLAIGTSAQKDPTTYHANRISLCNTVLEEYGDRVSVEVFNTLLVDFAKSKNTGFILRGLRNMMDFDYEFQMAEMNQSLWYAKLRRLAEISISLCTPQSPNRCGRISSGLKKKPRNKCSSQK